MVHQPPHSASTHPSPTSTGIGRHAAEHLARLGFTVLAGVRKQADADKLAAQGLPTLVPIIMDVTKPQDIEAAVAKAKALKLPLWGLVNNAGLGYPMPLEYSDMKRVRSVYEVNVLSIIAMTQAFLPLLRAAPHGRVVNVGSATGTMATQCDGIYGSSTHAVEGLPDAMRQELSLFDISVSLLVPGQVRAAGLGEHGGGGRAAWRGCGFMIMTNAFFFPHCPNKTPNSKT